MQSLLDRLMVHTDADAARSEDAVIIFDDVAVMAPRGRFEVEMHNSHFKMVGQVSGADGAASLVLKTRVVGLGTVILFIRRLCSLSVVRRQ
jgi:hypothetical protein